MTERAHTHAFREAVPTGENLRDHLREDHGVTDIDYVALPALLTIHGARHPYPIPGRIAALDHATTSAKNPRHSNPEHWTASQLRRHMSRDHHKPDAMLAVLDDFNLAGAHRAHHEEIDADPVRRLGVFMADNPALACSVEADGPGWYLAFITAKKPGSILTPRLVVVTNDGGEWCLTLNETRETFHEQGGHALTITAGKDATCEQIEHLAHALLYREGGER